MLSRLASAVRSLVTRAQVTGATVGPRTLLQITGLQGEVKSTVELLLPPGYSARPAAGADVTVLQVLGSRDHLVAVGGDAVGAVIADLAPGEFGITNGSQLIVVRSDHVQIVSPSYVLVDTPTLKCTGDILDNCNSQSRTVAAMRTVYDTHTHPNVQPGTVPSRPPTQAM